MIVRKRAHKSKRILKYLIKDLSLEVQVKVENAIKGLI